MVEWILNKVQQSVLPFRLWFNQKMQSVDFFGFCALYALLFVVLGWRLHRKQGWVAGTKEILTFKERLGAWVINLISTTPVIKGWWARKLKKEEAKVEALFDAEFGKNIDKRRVEGLPVTGMTVQNIKNRIEEWTKKESGLTSTQKISGSIYFAQDANYLADIQNFSKNYLYHNPLHLDTYKEVMRMESEVLQMTATLLTPPNERVFGVITTGGSESLIMAIYAYKNFYSSRTKPNIVVPETIHAAVDKGCFYFNVEIRKVRLQSNFEVDVGHMESLMDRNTIMIAGSAGNYPHGMIDDITAIAKLGKKKNVGVHVDACLGGFIISFNDSLKADLPPFNFKVDGVTSVSIDHHKFGLAPKGVSAVFYKTKELRQSQYYCKMDWCGGIYGTPTSTGSRNAVGTAGAWFAFNRITWEGYKENAKEVMETTRQVIAELRKMDEIVVFGEPKLCVISFTTRTISIFKLLKFMEREREWRISALHRPEGAHMTITLANHLKMRSDFAKDLKEGISTVQTKGEQYKGSTEALYGGTAEIPSMSVRENVLRVILKSYLK